MNIDMLLRIAYNKNYSLADKTIQSFKKCRKHKNVFSDVLQHRHNYQIFQKSSFHYLKTKQVKVWSAPQLDVQSHVV